MKTTFLYASQSHTAVTSTPSRLSKLERALKRFNIKQYEPDKVHIVEGRNGDYIVEPPVFSEPLRVLPSGKVIPFVDGSDKITYHNEVIGIIERMRDGIITANEALMDYSQLHDFFAE